MTVSWFPWLFWSVAFVASLLYGAFAIAIFTNRKEFSTPWLWHQRWLNFFGSIIGWLSAWLIILRHCDCSLNTCDNRPPDGWDLTGAMIAFLGMTGYLPWTLLGIAGGLRAVGLKTTKPIKDLLGKE